MLKLTRPQIQKRLDELGVSQAVFAETAGVSDSYVSHVFAGRKKSKYLTDMLSVLLGEPIEIIPVVGGKSNRLSREARELRDRLASMKSPIAIDREEAVQDV